MDKIIINRTALNQIEDIYTQLFNEGGVSVDMTVLIIESLIKYLRRNGIEPQFIVDAEDEWV